jgi:hypothetical protein
MADITANALDAKLNRYLVVLIVIAAVAGFILYQEFKEADDQLARIEGVLERIDGNADARVEVLIECFEDGDIDQVLFCYEQGLARLSNQVRPLPPEPVR